MRNEFKRESTGGIFVFKESDKDRALEIRWFMDDDYIMSEYTMMDKGDTLLFKETIVYTARRPMRKNR